MISYRYLNKFIRYMTYTVELIILFMLQETPGTMPLIFGIKPLLTLSLAITISLLEPEIPAMFFGILAGITMDFGLGAPVGGSCLILAVICCFLSAFAKNKLHVTIGSAMLTASFCLGIVTLLLWVFQFVLNGYSHVLTALANVYAPVYLYTVLVTPIVYVVNLGVFRALREE